MSETTANVANRSAPEHHLSDAAQQLDDLCPSLCSAARKWSGDVDALGTQT